MKRSKRVMTYHGRVGHPMVHETENGKKFIMVRARKIEGGGTKRLYLVRGKIPAKYKKKIKHRE